MSELISELVNSQCSNERKIKVKHKIKRVNVKLTI